MSLSRLELKYGVDPTHAADVLGKQIGDANAIGPSIGVEALQNAYLNWADACEAQLPYLTGDLETLTMFDTARARMIRELGPGALRPWPLIQAEVKLQVSMLERMLADLRQRIERYGMATGHVVVPDTNILLHYKPLYELPWPTLTASAEVRVVLPLRVIEELDQKKYAPRKDIARRARRLLPQLRSWIGPAGAPKEIASGVSLEVMVDSGPRRRPSDADEEILCACQELKQFGSSALSLVTGDTGLQLRAQAEQLVVIALGDNYRRVADPD